MIHPAELLLTPEEAELQKFFRSMVPTTSIVQRVDREYTIYLCKSKSSHSSLPTEAYQKMFAWDNPGGARELTALTMLKDDANLCVPKYYCHCTVDRRLYLYTNAFDSPLARVIENRASVGASWEERELWDHLHSLAVTVKKLHDRRVVHRDINPSNIFLLNGRLYICNFDRSKVIPPGQDLQFATIQPPTNYHSPQFHQAYDRQASITYDSSTKEDIWGIGRTLLDMATLQTNSALVGFYESNQQGQIEAYVHSLLSPRFSDYFILMIVTLLKYDADIRAYSDEFLNGILRFVYYNQKCATEQCRTIVRRVWGCAHVYCDRCMISSLLRQVKTGEDKGPLLCACKYPVQSEFVSLLPEKCQLLVWAAVHPKTECLGCVRQHDKVKYWGDEKRPYRVVCSECGAVFCSFCQLVGGHGKVLGINKGCSLFTE